MQASELGRFNREFLGRTVLPAARRPSRRDHEVIVGFDTEWDANTRDMLSMQLAVLGADGVPISRVFPASKPRMTVEWLAENLEVMLTEAVSVPVLHRKRRHVVLVAHFAGAELSMFQDPLRELGIEQFGKAHHARLPVLQNDRDGTSWKVRILDLYAFYKMSLSVVGRAVGLEKLEVDPKTLASLLKTSPAAFTAYAGRDAEICVAAFTKLRETVWEQWGVDVLRSSTLPGLAASIFRSRFLKSSPVPYRLERSTSRRNLRGNWLSESRDLAVYTGPMERRELALRAYWGGRVEAYVRGLVKQPVAELDAISLYPHAAILQPLPDQDTRWQLVSKPEELEELEGFVRLRFRFPKGTTYPCLPVMSERANRLLFPLQGETWCSIAEARAALRLGAKIAVLDGWGFTVGDRERDHDVARYMRAFLELKGSATKGTLEYETAKLLVNALVGKFAERRQQSATLDMDRALRATGGTGLSAALAGSPALRESLKGPVNGGRLWAPEWASLILGRARALMASIVARGALLVSTDSVIVPAGLSLVSDGLRDLRSIGSAMKLENEGDAVFIARSRLYAILRRADRIPSGARVLAADDTWAVVRVARHGTPETEKEFAETVLQCLREGKDVAPLRKKTRLLSAEAAVREGGEINQEVSREGKTYFRWDGKRRLVEPKVNPFLHQTPTTAYQSLAKLEGAEHQRLVKAGVARKRRVRRTSGVLERAAALLEQGIGIREVSRRTGMPRSTVSDLGRELRRASHIPR